jgi:hypothetical protein
MHQGVPIVKVNAAASGSARRSTTATADTEHHGQEQSRRFGRQAGDGEVKGEERYEGDASRGRTYGPFADGWKAIQIKTTR